MALFKDPNLNELNIFAQWEKETRPYPWNSDQFQQAQLSHTSKVLVWKGTADPNGFVVLQVFEEEAYIQNIMIAPQHQGKGWGKKMLEMVESWCRENKIRTVKLEVDPKNKKAADLYSGSGYEIIGKRDNAYPNGESALVMMKRI